MPSIVLPSRCDRGVAETLLLELQAALSHDRLTIDASQTTHLSMAVLQLLVSARKTGQGAVIVPSPALIEMARLTSLAAVLFDHSAKLKGDI